MNRDESVALFETCEAKREEARAAAQAADKSEGEARAAGHEAAKAHWNAWAEGLLFDQKAIERDGKWSAGRDRKGFHWGNNSATSDWIEKAKVDFSYCGFLVGKHQQASKLAKEQAEGSFNYGPQTVMIADRWVNFEGFIFPGCASFQSATFFCGVAFTGASFFSEAWFDKCTFYRATVFSAASFSGDTSFFNAYFRKQADFSSIQAKGQFSLIGSSYRRNIPEFLSAKLAEPVLFDDIRMKSGVAPGGFWRSVFGGFFRWRKGWLDVALSAKYRQLKRMAKESDDHRAEHLFFRGELRARRYVADKPWHSSFWLNIVYEAISDCGMAIVRPLAIWTLAAFGFAAFYLSQSEPVRTGLSLKDASFFGATIKTAAYAINQSPGCFLAGAPAQHDEPYVGGLTKEAGEKTSARAEALHLAFKNAFIFLDGGVEATHRIYGCLYGVEMYAGSNPVAHVPAAVSTASAVQKLFSGLMIFLFGLALRNMLKMK